MTLIRQALVFLRQLQNLNKKKYSLIFILSLVSAVVIGLIFDWFLPFIFITNTLRMLIATTFGASLFSILYINFPQMDNQDFRDQFTLTQRINTSLIILFITIIFFLFFVPPNSKVYTLMFGFVMYIIIYLITFCRPSREEYIKFSYGIKDERDLVTNRKNEEVEKNNETKE